MSGELDGDASTAASSAWRIRSTPEDFRVDEEPLYAPSGEGGHTFLQVEKRGRTTEQVARELARLSGCAGRDVGYAGRKDRHAVTRQWFSLPGLDPAQAMAFPLSDARVLDARRHGHKLRTGQLRGNRFEIVVRGDVENELEAVRERAEVLGRRGLPNRFGDQRFGRDGDNAEQARALVSGGRPPRDRRAARFLVSALQSLVFNAVLEARQDDYDGVREGDLARVEESGGLFWVDDLDREAPRAAAFEISATCPSPGTKVRAPRGTALAVVDAVFAALELPPASEWQLPRGLRARGARRPLRVRPGDLVIEPLSEGGGIRVGCRLPAGSYVTVLLEALAGPRRIVDASRGPRVPDGSPGAHVS